MSASRRPLRVLMIEDSADDCELMVRALREGGFAPTWKRVQTAAEVEAALGNEPWDVILSDHRMPCFSSTEALRIVLAQGEGPPFLIVSGSIGEEAAVAGMRAGARDWISKANLARLPAAIERELAEAEGRRARREAERGRREAEERYRSLVERIPAVTFMVDDKGKVLFVSPQAQGQSGYTVQEWAERPGLWLEIVHPEDRESIQTAWLESLARHGPFAREYRLLTRSNAIIWVQAEGQWSQQEGGGWVFQGFTVDVTDRKNAEALLRTLAYSDPATGLPNRARLAAWLDEELRAATEQHRPLALLQLRLKRIDEINNTLGRHNGDLVVQEAARRIAPLRGVDMLARVGSGSFALVARGATAEGARRLAEAAVAVLEQPITVQGLPVEVGGEVGIAVFPGHGSDAEILLRRANVAFASARRSLDGIALYSKDQDPYDPRRLLLMGDLRTAIETNQLRLEYQPKIELATRRVVGLEALLRWRHPEFGQVRPDEFVALAEECALIRPLTDWVLNEAFRQCHTWREAGMDLVVSANLSARNLQDPGLLARIDALIATWGVSPSWVGLEITESALMQDPKRAERQLAQLSERGVNLSIDDFGTGYSSLGYLRRLPVTEVKIDRTFVKDLASDKGDLPIVRTIVDCGHHLGLKVVAEGVEDARTWDLLADMGCDIAQGYLMARPMTPEDFAGWVARGEYGLVEPEKSGDAPND